MSQPLDLEPEEPLQPQVGGEPLPESAAQYEFNAIQNKVIRVLASKMKYVGFFMVFCGGLMTLVSIVTLFMKPWFGLFYLLLLAPQLLIGIWNVNAANSFGFVVTTEGNDIQHLMNALVSLRKLYTLMFWLMVPTVVLVAVGIVGGIFLWSSGPFPVSGGR